MIKIKRIIFDLDNTLIMWKPEYEEAYKQAIKEHNLAIDHTSQSKLLASYEKNYSTFNKENLLELINTTFNINSPQDFIDTWFNYLKNMSVENKEVTKVLEYLAPKYDLVVLTNFTSEVQKARLEKAGILKYFTHVYGGELYLKPHPEAFKNAIKPFKPSECLMIGDRIEVDITEALNLGCNVLHLTDKENPNIPTIKSLNELKKLL